LTPAPGNSRPPKAKVLLGIELALKSLFANVKCSAVFAYVTDVLPLRINIHKKLRRQVFEQEDSVQANTDPSSNTDEMKNVLAPI